MQKSKLKFFVLSSLRRVSASSTDGGISRGSFFSGSIPTELCSLTNLEVFGFVSNELTGTIPDCIGNLTGLTHFSTRSNNLKGTIPLSFNNLSKILLLDLSNNTFHGPFPEQWIGASSYILKLSLRDNEFTGSFADSELPDLQLLYCDRNFLNGSLPPLATSTNLYALTLSDNAFTGTVPSSYQNFTKLCKYTS